MNPPRSLPRNRPGRRQLRRHGPGCRCHPMSAEPPAPQTWAGVPMPSLPDRALASTKLGQRFGANPFSTLDAKQGVWQRHRRDASDANHVRWREADQRAPECRRDFQGLWLHARRRTCARRAPQCGGLAITVRLQLATTARTMGRHVTATRKSDAVNRTPTRNQDTMNDDSDRHHKQPGFIIHMCTCECERVFTQKCPARRGACPSYRHRPEVACIRPPAFKSEIIRFDSSFERTTSHTSPRPAPV
jgi:hypothetical protein